MNICVFGAASSIIDEKYFSIVEDLCCSLAKNGHNLVFGAGGTGLMGAAAKGFKKGGGKVIGVIPTFFREENVEVIYKHCDEIIFTETMQERKLTMETLADAFITVPGGIGTYEELFEILTLKQLKLHEKPIAIYNIDGYFNEFNELINVATNKKFIPESIEKLYICTDNNDKILEYIESNNELSMTIEDMKNS